MKNDKRKAFDNKPKIEYTATFKVKRSDELLNFLLEKINTSRNNVKNLLSNHQVLVNGSVVTQYNFMLAKEDEIKLTKKPVTDNTRRQAEKKKRPPKIEILYEDEDFFAINKPNGLLSVESDKDNESAFNYVLMFMQEKSKTNRPFVIHRIDKETSGVLVFAKNPKVQSILRLNWDKFVKTREYVAIVEGHMERDTERITSYLLEDKNNLMYVSKGNEGQKAITNYKVTRKNNAYSMLKVDIETGRKNQIRVVLKSLGHPIIGDDKYNALGKNPIKRLGLHASKLEFVDPISRKLISIESKIPAIFKSFFE